MTENLLRYDNESKFTFLDMETEGLCLSEQKNLPWQISFITYKNDKTLREYNFYIKWDFKLNVSYSARKKTGYDEQKVNDLGKKPEEVFEVLDYELKDSNIIAGHNILGFDAYITQSFYKKLNRAPYNIVPKVLDTFALAKAYKLEIPYNKEDNFVAWQYRILHRRDKRLGCSLGALGKEFDIKFNEENLHDALFDLKLNIKIFNKLKWLINI